MSKEPVTVSIASSAEAHIPASARLPFDPPPAPPATFDFSVSSMTVKNPRSLFNDTDFATLAINVLAADNTVLKQYGPTVKSLGNLGKGAMSHPGMALTGLTIPDGGSIAIAFVVVNKGGWDWDSETINALELAGTAVLGALAQGSIAGATTTTIAADGTVTVAPTLIPLAYVIAIAAALVTLLEGVNILFADCDGTVVPGAMTIGKTELLQLASPGPWNITFEYPGTNSPDGCGANSDYLVTYSVEATPAPVVVPKVAVPEIKGLSIANGVRALTAAGLIGIEKVTQFSAHPTTTILGQSPAAGTQVAVHSEVQYNVEGRPPVPKPGHQTP
jgi:PASTA domain-containing protein